MADYFSYSKANTLLSAITEKIFGAFKRGTSVVGVDIGSSAIKIVQLKEKGGKAVLETYGELALGPYAKLAIGQATSLPQEKIAEALSDVIKEANITSDDAGFAIPLSASLISVIEMPFISEGRLKEMVPLEARKYIPVPITEVNLDWQLIPQEEATPAAEELPKEREKHALSEGPVLPTQKGRRTKVKVLLAAIHNQILYQYQQIAEQAGLAVKFFEIEVFSSIRAVLARERSTVFILDIGAGTSKLFTVEDGIILSSHIINRGSQDITHAISRSQGMNMIRAEETKRQVGLSEDPSHKELYEVMILIVNSIFNDAKRAILDHEKKYHKPVSKLVLSGGGSLLKGIQETAQENFDMEVALANPFMKVETPAFLEKTLQGAGPNFAVALGAALRRLQELE